MKFAHMSDCHLGSWSNHPDLRDYSIIAFERAIEECIKENVDFVIIAGDLFDTSIPPIDVLRRAAAKFRQLKEADIGVYAISGSHDYSPSGKTMLSVLEDAGLLFNVFKYDEIDGRIRLKFTEDRKTGTKFTGIMGRKGSLEISFYKRLDKSIEDEPGNKIFVFHAGIEENKPGIMADMITVSINDLPKGFMYYATGHIHKQFFDKKHRIVFPGELFPTSFDELEDYNGGFVIVETRGDDIDVRWKTVRLFDVALMKFSVDDRKPYEVEKETVAKIESSDLGGKVLLLKFDGVLDGKISDIDFKSIAGAAENRGAIIVKKSTSGIKTKEFREISMRQFSSMEQIEREIIGDHKDMLALDGIGDVESLAMNVMSALGDEKIEDETVATFEERLKSNMKKVLGL